MGQGTLTISRVLLELNVGDVLVCDSHTGSFTLIRNSDGSVIDLNELIPGMAEGDRSMGMQVMNPITFAHICGLLTALQGLSCSGAAFQGHVFTCTVCEPEPRGDDDQMAYEAAGFTVYEPAARHRLECSVVQLATTDQYVLLAEDGATLLPGADCQWVHSFDSAVVAQSEYGLGELRYIPIPGDPVWYLARMGPQVRGSLLYAFELQLRYPRRDDSYRFVCLQSVGSQAEVQCGYWQRDSRNILDLRSLPIEGTELPSWLMANMRACEAAGQPT